MQGALNWVADQLGREYPLVIGGERIETQHKFESHNPARPSEVIGVHQKAGVAEANRAVEAASRAFATWKYQPLQDRVSLLLRAAEILRDRKFEFCAWLTLEVGKNWAEADADVAECIDFLDFYAREALRLSGSQTPIQYPGEKNELHYIPLGVGAVIPPWNFPLAIAAGMAAAAIVTGNTVVLKPSPDAPTIAARFVDLLEEAGMPAGVVNLIQGGPEPGNALVEHPHVRFIAFTGSRAVGLEINEKAAKPRAGQLWLKRTILEMGGKDATIVTADADIDSAVEGVLAGAFGFSGQKCSASSRAIVEDTVYDVFLEKIRERIDEIAVGDPQGQRPHGSGHQCCGPRSCAQVHRDWQDRRPPARWAAMPSKLPKAAISSNPPSSPIFRRMHAWRRKRSSGRFWPVLRAKDFTEALEIANGTEYGLTGAVYSTQPENLDRAQPRIPCRQSLLQSQVHGRHGWRASVRRLQYVGNRLQSRWSGLPSAVHAG